MSAAELIPKGLKLVELKHGMGEKNSPIRYFPKQDPVQDALNKTKKIAYFKLTLPNNKNELKMVIWALGTPEQFLLHVCTAVEMCKQIGLDTNYANSTMALEAAYCELGAAKTEYAQLAKATKRRQKIRRRRVQIWILKSMSCHLP